MPSQGTDLWPQATSTKKVRPCVFDLWEGTTIYSRHSTITPPMAKYNKKSAVRLSICLSVALLKPLNNSQYSSGAEAITSSVQKSNACLSACP